MTDQSMMAQLARLLPHMLDVIEDSIYIMRVDNGTFRYEYVNRSATRFSGITMDAAGMSFGEINQPEMAEYLHKKYSNVLDKRKSIKFEDGILMPNGSFSGESILTPIMDAEGNITHIISVTRETTERKQYEEQLHHYAYQDDLTKLYNRRYLLEHVQQPDVLYLFDLDNFKNINDTFGHDAGDLLLMEAAGRLKDRFGSEAELIRLGGDEFIVAYMQKKQGPGDGARFIKELFHQPFTVNGRELYISASIGVAVRKRDEDTPTLLKQADIALYRVKGNGRNGYHIYEATAKYEHVENFIQELNKGEAGHRSIG
ncbi:diguanylate cyclase domain-containing protein [Paenibacillus gansuensis]|uniref:Diguanylate cyclase domain-containing protein n=1 Tax=Paenibacillus gansuensis TaxID=306542 RepID=A0ABW5P8L6_9BACL